MATPKQFETNNLQNSSQVLRTSASNAIGGAQRAVGYTPVLPPRPAVGGGMYGTPYNSYMGYSGGYASMPYRSSMYGSPYASYGGYGGYGGGMYGAMATGPYGYDDAESRFIQYAEESSRTTFASVENIVRAFGSIAMMLDNTFFAMTSSFRAVLSVAENFGKLRTTFGHIWYSLNVFRFASFLLRKLRELFGLKRSSSSSSAWSEAGGATGGPRGSSWPTWAFLGMLLSAPYIINKFIPKFEDKGRPANWKTAGVKAKVAFDFVATAPSELSVQANDVVTLAPTQVQQEMRLKNTGWAFAVLDDNKSGIVPLNYLLISKTSPPALESSLKNGAPVKHTKRVSFGENQIFENIDLEDYKPEAAEAEAPEKV